MANEYTPQAVPPPHHVTLDGRHDLAVSGVRDVESFDEDMVVLLTVRGTLVVRGSDLHLRMLNPEGGQVSVDGQVDSLTYEEDDGGKQGFFSRLLG